MNNARLEELRSKFQENPRRYFAPYANELRKGGDPAQAISVCRTHLATQPGHVSGHIVLGQALYEAGEATEARNVFAAALDLDPENLIALRTLGEISQVNGEFSSARQWYERLLEADPRNSEVVQLLRDLPTEDTTPAPEPVQAQAAETTLEEHQQDHSPYAPPVAAPSFHSGFTGPGPAYKTAEDIAEEERQAQEAAQASAAASVPVSEAMAFVEMDAAPSEPEAVSQPEAHDDWQPAAEEPQHDAIDMVDFDAFAAPVEATHEAATQPVDFSLPNEAPAETTEAAAELDFSLADSVPEPVNHAAAEPQAVAEIDLPSAESEESTDHPRAKFAERGFDGPAGDTISWMMTPSAVESEPESAPEDWFDVPAAETQEVASEPEATETQATAAATSQATDAWFDDVPTSNVVEPTEGLTSEDEFWLPPDLSEIRTTPAVAAQSDSESEMIPQAEAPEQEPMPVLASAEESIPEPVSEERTSEPVAEEAIVEPYAAQPVAEEAIVEPYAAQPVADEASVEPYAAEPVAEIEYEAASFHEEVESPMTAAGESSVSDSFRASLESEPEQVESAPLMNAADEPDFADAMESASMEAEFPPVAETSEQEPEYQAPASSIEYFDHSASVHEPAYDESHEAAPAAEWSDPFASRETEPYAEAVPEAAPTESAWESPVLEAAPEEEAPVAEAASGESESAMAEPMAVEPSETFAGDVDSAETFSADVASSDEMFSVDAPTEAFTGEVAPPDESRYAEPVVTQSSAMAEASAQSTPAPFITETLAELYLQQGFRDEAVSIYRQLIERDPANGSLRDRLARIERKDDDQRASVHQAAASDRSGSQSVRTFFSKIARRPATNPSTSSSQSEAVPQSDVPFASAASALANLFAASKPTVEDEGAASNLANAYGNPAGRPSRAADRELSLDHLFRDVPPGGSPAGGMSLDEFYSAPNAETGSPTEPSEAGESPESGGADIRQFTAWLEGLRKK